MSVDMVLNPNHQPENPNLASARGDIDSLFADIVGATVESLGEAPHKPSVAERALGSMVSTEAHTRFPNRRNGGRPRSSTEELGSPEVSKIATLAEIMGLTAAAVLAERFAATDEQFALAA